MGRILHLQQWAVVLSAAVVGLSLGPAIQAQALSPSPLPPAGELPPREAPSSEPASASAADLTVKEYKVRLGRVDPGTTSIQSWFDSGTTEFESWIVFHVIGDTTIFLLRHATTDGYGKWWDHPVLSSQACRIIQADGGDRLVDCQRATRTGPGEALRIVLPQGTFLQPSLLTFTWKESGRIHEGVLRIENGLVIDTDRPGPPQEPKVIRQPRAAPIPHDRIEPPGFQPRVSDSRRWRYKVKLSPGNAWQNLKPESWVVLDVVRGTTITLKHSTNSYNIITGFSRWWDHPIRSITACPLHPSEGSDRSAGCLQGSSAAPGEPLRILLPVGTSLHDYRFTFTWEENGRTQEGATIVDRMVQPNAIPPP